jgi:nucleoside-diphosphate-sugar epimerase
MNILITGGAGFIGSHLAKHHLHLGHRVVIIDNFLTGSRSNLNGVTKENNLTIVEADVIDFDFSSLSALPNIVYHLASPASPIQYKKYPLETMRVNAEGTRRILKYLYDKAPHARFVLASTSEVYGDPLVHPQNEMYWGNVNPNGVRSMYDEAKRYAEALTMVYVRTYDIDCRIARIFNTYGPYMEKNDGRVISNFCYQATHNLPITVYGDGSQTRSFCFVRDLVGGLILLASQPDLKGEVVNLGSRDERQVLAIARLIKNLAQSNSPIIHSPIEADDPRRRQPDITRAKDLLGWEPKISIENGLRETINYFRSLA